MLATAEHGTSKLHPHPDVLDGNVLCRKNRVGTSAGQRTITADGSRRLSY